MEESQPTLSFTRLFSFWTRLGLRKQLVVSFCALILIGLFFTRPPQNFPAKSVLVVRENASINEVGTYLLEQNAISSPFLFKWTVRLLNPQNGVLSGMYYFEKPSNLVSVAYRISHGEFGLTPLVLTVPEGTNIFQLADIAKKTFPAFDKQTFQKVAKSEEGYLFPDTYHFLPNVSAKEIVDTMKKNFETKIATVQGELQSFGRPLDQVIKMASYLEEEARLTLTRRMVAGILWKRLKLGMPLQIDASFQYVNGKNTYQLTLDDLKIDSPYNTYVYKGFTPTPISNPGLDAIRAAVTPIESKYFFFLSDKEGVMHYAVTHAEHVANKEKYLR